MDDPVSRRAFLTGVGGAALAVAASPTFARAEADEAGKLWIGFPRQNQALVREVVGAAHRDEKRVRELVDRHPALVNAWWDWGFGDWESPLGAASHTGRHAIAEYLLERGARLDLFAATMLGHTSAVRAMIEAVPGAQRTLGPHCITLLSHAQAGGEKAKDTYEYLRTLGDADRKPEAKSLSSEQASPYVGVYSFGADVGDRLSVSVEKGQLTITKTGEGGRALHSRGEHRFFPAGVPSIEVRFELDGAEARALSIHDPELVVRAPRA